jgi:anti-anti-sigma regulatory factor
MLAIRVEKLGDLALIECKGRIVSSDSVCKLRDAVMAQSNARIVALDLSAVEAIGGGGLGMLAFLQRWTNDHAIQLKIFSPSEPVMRVLNTGHLQMDIEFDIASFQEMMMILSQADSRYALAA